MNRRTFIHTAAALSAGVAAVARAGTTRVQGAGQGAAQAPSALRQPTEKERARRAAFRALEVAKGLGATYADVRVVRVRHQHLLLQDERVADVLDEESYGAGVRVVVGGAFGFCATPRVTEADLGAAAERAVKLAQALRGAVSKPAALAPAPQVQTRWVAPFQVDPFVLPLEIKLETLLKAARGARDIKAAGVQLQVEASLRLLREESTLYASQGAIIEQLAIRTAPRLRVIAMDRGRGELEERESDGDFPARTIGWEYLQRDKFIEQAPRWAEDAVRALRAQEPAPGTYDLILLPSHLDLLLHGTLARATQLQRVLGDLPDGADGAGSGDTGGSFVTLPNLNRMQLAAPGVSVVADRTQPEGLATCGYDDEGDAAQRFHLVRQGKLVALQTTREQAALLAEPQGRGCARAGGWAQPPGAALPNVSLEPGTEPLSLADLIADSKRAIYIEGRGRLSVAPQLQSFAGGGGSAWLIENGKKKTPLRRVGYESGTLAFFRACDRLCDQREYRLGGVLPPPDEGPALGSSHGAPPARFRGVKVTRTAPARPGGRT